MKVFIVGEYGPEHNLIISIHKTRKGAFRAWNNHRLHLLHSAKQSLKDEKYDKKMKDLYSDTPYIREYDIEK